jgi:hypothetical protein
MVLVTTDRLNAAQLQVARMLDRDERAFAQTYLRLLRVGVTRANDAPIDSALATSNGHPTLLSFSQRVATINYVNAILGGAK